MKSMATTSLTKINVPRIKKIAHRFVDRIPSDLNDGVIYVSIEYATAVHNCCCGCGNKVVTPITPVDWQLRFDGESVSLEPSIGNWSFPCKSHYWISHNQVKWAPTWPAEKVAAGRARDRRLTDNYFGSAEGAGTDKSRLNDAGTTTKSPLMSRLVDAVRKLLGG
jgi:hypothetical protein